MIKAAIDIGTNSTRLLIAEINDTKKTDLHREARITRLGKNVNQTKVLSAESTKNTIEVLIDYKNIAESLGATEFRVGATSAARDAKNIADFIDTVHKETDLKLKVLTSEEEATLSFKGATRIDCPLPTPDSQLSTAVIDIGGGSTEISVGNIANKEPELFYSKDIGSVRLTELFVQKDPPTDSELSKAADYITKVYRQPVEKITSSYSDFTVIGTAGTITTIAAINLGLKKYDPLVIHRSNLTIQSVETIFNHLKKLPTNKRAEIKAIQPGREDVIVMGALILLTLLKMLKIDELIVSEADILDGLLLN